MLKPFRLALALLITDGSAAQAQWSSGRPDGHAPFGVAMDHTHDWYLTIGAQYSGRTGWFGS